VERPACKCHGEPMLRNAHERNGSQKWCCAIKRKKRAKEAYWQKGVREKLIEQYRQRVAEGVCVNCRGPLTSSVLCWECLNRQEARYAVRV
jgi:hypothetical protein